MPANLISNTRGNLDYRELFQDGFRADLLFRPRNPSPYGRVVIESRAQMPRFPRTGPASFEEMGIKPSENDTDCIIM